MNDTAIPSKSSSRARRIWAAVAIGLCGWGGLAYVTLPFAWRHYEHERGLDGREMTTRTAQGIAGDPINIGLVGTEADIVCAFDAANWSPANPVTFASSLKIIGSVIFSRPYAAAPVSPLFYDGRREDLAFQMPEGHSADTRHHIRLWRVLETNGSDRPVWLGAASFDRGVGFSHYTLQVTHHISADIDAERDFVSDALAKAGVVVSLFEVSGVGPTLNGRNGGGDRYFTDGEVVVAVLAPDCKKRPGETPKVLPNPPLVDLKNKVWRGLRPLM